ncbi:MAG: hypothetical protein IBGAMO2_180002 [Arenicellales bacterium IbO2]|nr:pentapeptide repeat-containing protein [Gammaproteobacteria bacterium]MDA8009979.1 pentapeptide repeat-containing protein [Alphaproteobacteria bacterium]CAJ2376016.1 MAG: hypothetical protein IBGAMO2_180002 [Arenicellales bacterium IbO2]
MAVLGLWLAFEVAQHELLFALSGAEKMTGVLEKLLASLHVIILGLPAVTTLWWFRTHDTLEQIQKTKESTDVNILFGAQQMMFEDADGKPGTKNFVGFAQLMLLRQQGSHLDVIDLATREVNLSEFTTYPFLISMRGADLSHANLQKSCFLMDADLRDADLITANLARADLAGANLQGAVMAGADLQKTRLVGTNLQGVDLRDADLKHAYLQGAYLQGADLKDAQCLGANFQDAEYSDDTRFPAGFDPVKEGMVKVP